MDTVLMTLYPFFPERRACVDLAKPAKDPLPALTAVGQPLNAGPNTACGGNGHEWPWTVPASLVVQRTITASQRRESMPQVLV
jgi:hypothetical protein